MKRRTSFVESRLLLAMRPAPLRIMAIEERFGRDLGEIVSRLVGEGKAERCHDDGGEPAIRLTAYGRSVCPSRRALQLGHSRALASEVHS